MPRLRSRKNEEWRPIPGYEDLYLISNQGRVASIIGARRALAFDWSGRDHCQYRSVRLYKGGKSRKLLVHRLVYLAFHGEIEFGLQVDHIDHDRLNNHAGNLQLVTHEENQRRKKNRPVDPVMQAARDQLFEELGINI